MVFTPFRLRELELKNRWIMLAMHTGFATGNALTERDYAFYEERAKGGAAAVAAVFLVAAVVMNLFSAGTVLVQGAVAGMKQGHLRECMTRKR